jgi:hypothetical protein
MGTLCRPQGYSWLDASRVATEDRRAVNPGFGFVTEGVKGAGAGAGVEGEGGELEVVGGMPWGGEKGLEKTA